MIGDGMFWRRTIEPDINVRAILPVLVELVGSLLNPVEPVALPKTLVLASKKEAGL